MSNERRTSRRLPVPAERQSVALKLGRRLVEGRLVDLSAGGFSVELASAEAFETGTQIELRTCDGAHVVEIARVSNEGDTTCLGLVRVSDIVCCPSARRRASGRLLRAGNPMFFLPVLGGVVVCAGTVFAAWMGPDWMEKSVIRPTRQAIVTQFEAGRRPPPPPAAAGETVQKSVPVPESIEDESQTNGDEIGASWTAWSSHLKLTAEQFERLKSKFDDKLDELTPAQLGEASDATLKKVYSVLTPAQQRQMSDFIASSRAPGDEAGQPQK